MTSPEETAAPPPAEGFEDGQLTELLGLLETIGTAFEQHGLEAMAVQLTRGLVEKLGCEYAEVSRRGAAEQRLAVAGIETGTTRLRWPLLLSSESLHLRVDGSLRQCALVERLLRAMQPWLRAISATPPRVAVEGRLAQLGVLWRLSHKQTQVLHWLGLGLSNKEIAQRLGCSLKTVEAHISQLLLRSGLRGRGDLLQKVWLGDGPGEKG